VPDLRQPTMNTYGFTPVGFPGSTPGSIGKRGQGAILTVSHRLPRLAEGPARGRRLGERSETRPWRVSLAGHARFSSTETPGRRDNAETGVQMSRAPVLYVLKRFPRLSETFVLRELLELEAQGERILIDALLPPEAGPRHAELAALRASVRYLPRHPRLRQPRVAATHLAVGLRSPLVWVRLAARARRHGTWRRFLQAGLTAARARKEGARHLHAHFATAATDVARDAAALAHRPFTVTAHAKDIFHADYAPQLARRLENASAVVTVSEHNARHLRGVLDGVPVHHIPNGVRPGPPAPASPDGPLLFVGRLVAKKGVDVLIDACALLSAELPELRLEILGGGPLAEDLAGRARRVGIAARVRFLGPQPAEEVEAAFRRCSLVALPCRIDEQGDREGMPTVLVEALARGVPVVATHVVGIPELVRHRETGLLVPPNDPRALAAAIARLIRDPELARTLAARGRALIAERFDPGRSAMLLRALFDGPSR
jgi:colanic acid/amylovoran biosynthesis glycosyltransferase